MKNEPLISIVMPARNAAAFIHDAIASVLHQTWKNWELLVVDNGSDDDTAAIARSFNDPRIQLFHQAIRGVGHARNMALSRIRGTFYCFLDADDMLPPNSLADRAALLMENEAVHFADGGVQAFDERTSNIWTRSPRYRGPSPLHELYTISDSCFLGTTWMIRRSSDTVPLFDTGMTHAEELFYYMSIAHKGAYDHVSRPVLLYRISPGSAMSDIVGLHKGYRQLVAGMNHLPSPPNDSELQYAWGRIRKIMWRTYLKRGMPLAAFRAFFESRPKPGPAPKIIP